MRNDVEPTMLSSFREPAKVSGPSAKTPMRYLVVEQKQLDFMSLFRIPVGVVVLIVTIAVVSAVLIPVQTAVFGNHSEWSLKITVLLAFGIGFGATVDARSVLTLQTNAAHLGLHEGRIHIFQMNVSPDGSEVAPLPYGEEPE
jgi:high-affinity K+ transport system ATPase subunit B